MIVEFSTEVNTYVIQPPEPNPNNQPYMFQGETGTQLENVTAAVAKDQSEVENPRLGESLVKDIPGAQVGDTLHVVVVTYQDGDTFGYYGGHTKVVDAFTDPSEADSLRHALKAHGKDSYQFEHNYVSYYLPYAGYFEHIESIEVWGVTLKPYHDYRQGW